MCQEQTDPFSVACNALLCSRTCSPSHGLVGPNELRALAFTRHPASPRPHAVNEENAALRKAIKDAGYEYGVGLLRLKQLDLANQQLISQSGKEFLNAFASSVQRSRRGATCAFSTSLTL